MDVRVQLEQKLGKGIGASSNEELFCAEKPMPENQVFSIRF